MHVHPDQAIDQRSGPSRSRWVSHQARRLRHHRQVVVFEQHRHRSWIELQLAGGRDVRFDSLAAIQPKRFRLRNAVHQDPSSGDGMIFLHGLDPHKTLSLGAEIMPKVFFRMSRCLGLLRKDGEGERGIGLVVLGFEVNG